MISFVEGERFQGREQRKHNLLVPISCGHSWPLRRDAQGSNSFSSSQGPQENALVVRTFMMFGPGVHDPKGAWKTLRTRSLCWFLAPNSAKSASNGGSSKGFHREVLHGVGADGVGVKFPFFAVNFAVVCPCPLGEEEKSEKKREKMRLKKKGKIRKKRGKSLRPHLHQPH